MRAAVPFLVLASLALAGCVTPTPEERRAADEAQCRDYGFRRGTDAFAQCLQRIDLEREDDRRARLYGPGYGAGFGVGVGYGRFGW